MTLRPICVRLSEETVVRVDALAAAAGQDRSVWLRETIEAVSSASVLEDSLSERLSGSAASAGG